MPRFVQRSIGHSSAVPPLDSSADRDHRASGTNPRDHAVTRSSREQRAHRPLLADRPRHPRTPGGTRLGCQGGRPVRRRSARRVPPTRAAFRRALCAICGHLPQRGPTRQFSNGSLVKLRWGQNIELLAVKDPAVRLWYAEAALAHGWSRPVLAHRIATRLKDRQGQAVTDFARTLPRATPIWRSRSSRTPTSSIS